MGTLCGDLVLGDCSKEASQKACEKSNEVTCQTSFEEADDDFLRDMHEAIRTKFFANPAFQQDDFSQRRSFATSSFEEVLSHREQASRDFLHESSSIQRHFTTSSFECQSTSPLTLQQKERHHQKKRGGSSSMSYGAIYLEGTKTDKRSYADTEVPFLQESNFLYLSGVNRPDCLYLHDIESQTSYLFVPNEQFSLFYATWIGTVLTLDQLTELYGYPVLYLDDFDEVLANLSGGADPDYVIYTLPTEVESEHLSGYTVNDQSLIPVLYEERSVKVDKEVDLLRVAAQVSSDAHKQCMKLIRKGLHEYTMSARFVDYIGKCGLSHLAYETIAGAGNHSAILHYLASGEQLKSSDIFLIDAGGQYHGYTSDITRTYPVDGSFSSKQKVLYNMVLNVQLACIDEIAPGVDFDEVRLNASRFICQELIENNFVIGNVSSCLEEEIFGLFMPHGLGHFIGLDVHDTTIYPSTPLQVNNALTIEPGIYFNEPLLSPVLAEGNSTTRGSLLNDELIQSYLDAEIGGVRIEDDVLVTPDGFEVISVLPKTIKSIEKMMKKSP